MSTRRAHHNRPRRGFSIIELVIVMVVMGVFAGLAIPRVSAGWNRAEAAAQQIRGVFLTAQRTSLTRQYDVIVSFDTARSLVRIGEDTNNDGIITATNPAEWKFWRSIGDGKFMIPPVRADNVTSGSTSIVGTFKTVDGMPSILFHRDGSASSDAEIYVGNTFKRQPTDWRLVTLVRSTGRSDLYRLSGGKTWIAGTR
jgi:prepilin-type N-terminal cleavage/methylation domain-containing protein